MTVLEESIDLEEVIAVERLWRISAPYVFKRDKNDTDHLHLAGIVAVRDSNDPTQGEPYRVNFGDTLRFLHELNPQSDQTRDPERVKIIEHNIDVLCSIREDLAATQHLAFDDPEASFMEKIAPFRKTQLVSLPAEALKL